MTIQQAPKRLAPESAKTRKAREKLKRHWTDLEKKITPEALQEKTDEIHRWIARHAHQRIHLKNKNISLFDENQNAAKISQRVRAIAQKLGEDMQRLVMAIRPE
ncbi:MAG: hypothetical protein HW387_214 [Parachlamydiales bacterium]|nr:hypothetical protein [Parachlamydiales bacterium]